METTENNSADLANTIRLIRNNTGEKYLEIKNLGYLPAKQIYQYEITVANNPSINIDARIGKNDDEIKFNIYDDNTHIATFYHNYGENCTYENYTEHNPNSGINLLVALLSELLKNLSNERLN